MSQNENTGAVGSGTLEVDGGPGTATPLPAPELQAPGPPPGFAPAFNTTGTAGPPEPFFAPTPRKDGRILGYGHARTGRMPPYGGSPSTGPLTGVPLMRPAPPPPPAVRKQALEPGRQVPDPFLKIAGSVEVPPRDPGDEPAAPERIERSAAAVRAAGRRRPGAGTPGRVAAAAGPAGAGGAQLAASMGLPAAESVRASGRGTYVAGRAVGRTEPETTVARDAGEPCAAPGRHAAQPLTPLQSLRRYAGQREATIEKVGGEPDPSAARQPEIRPITVSGPGTKALSVGMKAFSKGRQGGGPGQRVSLAAEGKQESASAMKDAAEERRLLALNAQVGGLAGRFGARHRCLMDMTEVLRPKSAVATGPGVERRGTGAAASDAAPRSAVPGTRQSVGLRSAPPSGDDGCALPQKYPARAGVSMRGSAASTAREATPPGAAGPAQADEGIAAGRQSPQGQQAHPRQDGADPRARDEAAPGAGAATRPAVVVQGMGGPSTPLLLDLDRKFRREANARIEVQNAAKDLAELATRSIDSIQDAKTKAKLFRKNASALEKLGRAGEGMGGKSYAGYSSDLAQAMNSSLHLMAEVAAQGKAAKGGIAVAAAEIAATNDVARHAVAALDDLRRQQREIRERGRALGNMDISTLRRRAIEAEHRAERDSLRQERRALRHERGGVFKARQFAEVTTASRRAFDEERSASRFQIQADRVKEGSAAQARAQRQADYHGSLAEAERHRASAARAHILGRELANTKGAKEDRARSEQYYRNERKLADLNRFRAGLEPRLESIDWQLDALVEKDTRGFPNKDHGAYVPKNPKDRAKVERLQKEQDRLLKRMASKLGMPQGRPGDRTWSGIGDLQRENNAIADAASGPFAGTPAGLAVRMLRDPGAIPRGILAHVEAQVNSMMNEIIADASARSEAARKGGLDPGIAQYDESLSAEQRQAAAESYTAAVDAAVQAVQEIEDAIKVKREDGAYFESGWDEYDEDKKKLDKARENLEFLLDVCNHPACDKKRKDCEADSSAFVTCWLVPGSPHGGQGKQADPKKGDGSSTSSVGDVSAPGGGEAVSPSGSAESDGTDKPDGDKEQPQEKEPVEPSGQQPGESRTVSPETKEPPKEKEPLPQFEWPSFGEIVRQAAGGVAAFAASVRAEIEQAVEETSAWLEEAAAEAERIEKARKEDEAYVRRKIEEFMIKRARVLGRLAEVMARAATRQQAIAAAREAQDQIQRALQVLRQQAGELLEGLVPEPELPGGVKFGSPEYRLLMRARGSSVIVGAPIKGSDKKKLDRLALLTRTFESQLASIGAYEVALSESTDVEATDARLEIGEALLKEHANVAGLWLLANGLEGRSRAEVDAAFRDIDTRLQWAEVAADHAEQATIVAEQYETVRNGYARFLKGAVAVVAAANADPSPKVDWATAEAHHFSTHWRPNLHTPGDDIERSIAEYRVETDRLRSRVADAGKRIASEERLAGAVLKFAAVAVVAAGFIAGGAPGMAMLIGTGLVGGTAYSAAQQGVTIWQHGGEFDVAEMLETGALAGATAPVLAIPGFGEVAGAVGVGYGLGHGGAKLAEGEWSGGVEAAFSALAAFGMIRPGGGGGIEAAAETAPRLSGRSGVRGAVEGAEGTAIGGRRVTQFYDPDPRKGSFGPGAPEALTSTPIRGIEGAFERVIDGPWVGRRTARTWVAPRAGAEHNWWSRMWTGRGRYRHYVEFDALPGEMANPAWPKVLFSRYQQVMGPGVQLAGRNPTFGVLAPNYGQIIFLGTAVPAGIAGGYAVYRWLSDE